MVVVPAVVRLVVRLVQTIGRTGREREREGGGGRKRESRIVVVPSSLRRGVASLWQSNTVLSAFTV